MTCPSKTNKLNVAIQTVLDPYHALVGQKLPGLMNAFYLEGSIALGGFNERFSDIDFIATLQRRLTPAEIETLRGIHQQIEKSHPRWKMSGSYLPADFFARPNDAEPNLHYHDGRLRQDAHFVLNSVEGWILKNHGVTLFGPSAQTLPIAIDWQQLIREMRENLNTYWRKWTRQPDRFVVLLSDWGVQWAVLGVLRQFYSFREDSITTKTKAGEYALTCLPTRWHWLIQEAINIREGKRASAYRFRITRAVDAVKFLKFVIRTCNDTD